MITSGFVCVWLAVKPTIREILKYLYLFALVLAGASGLISAPFETSCRIEQSSSGMIAVVYQGGPSDPDFSDYRPGFNTPGG
jgi:hypothetical protein